MQYIHLSAYKFIELHTASLPLLRDQLKQQTQAHGIKGTILLSTEGINLFLAGTKAATDTLMAYLRTIAEFTDLWFKTTTSEHIPYQRMLVRIKKEIITMNQASIQPQKHTAPYIEPQQLKQWYDSKQPMIMLDTRNTYEFNAGTFDQAIHCNIENFSDFPQAVANLPEAMKTQPIVTFCTGGIRCEKAGAYLLQQGFQNVWQLKGGILNYFQQCGGDHFNGDCFVFDDRMRLDANLQSYSLLNPPISRVNE